MYFNVMKTDVV